MRRAGWLAVLATRRRRGAGRPPVPRSGPASGPGPGLTAWVAMPD